MFYVRGFYKIKRITKCNQYKNALKKFLLSEYVKGKIILSAEGINGTISGKKKNLNNCIKCSRDVTQGGMDDYTGELVCINCITQSRVKIGKNSCTFLKQLSDLHLDNLNTISVSDSDIMDSICFLESFMLFHVEGFKKVRSLDFLRTMINSSISLL